MICSTSYRTLLSIAGSAIMMLGTFALLKASAPSATPRSELVRYHDADLDKPEKLYKRLHAAAERVCAPLKGQGFANTQRLNACIQQAVGGAVGSINDPKLNALHSATMSRWQLASEQPVNPGA